MMDWVLKSLEQMPSLKRYQEQIYDIIKNIEDNPDSSIELCKSVIEGVCKTIINDHGKEAGDKSDLSPLVKKTLSCFNLADEKHKKHIDNLMTRVANVAHKIGEIRNDSSYAAHGKDISHIRMSKTLALFTVHTTNAILGFILHLHAKYRNYTPEHRIRYEDYPEFNQYLDELSDIEVGGVKLSISKALYEQDPIAYMGSVSEFNIDIEKENTEKEDTDSLGFISARY